MKVKELLANIELYKKEHSDFLEWNIYTEQLCEEEKKGFKKQGLETIKDSEDWEYYKTYGFNTLFPDKKIFTININY